MSLYDDLDPTETKKPDSNVAGWASGIKFLQSHMQLKKATATLPKRDMTRKNVSTLAPVIDFKASNKVTANKDDSDEPKSQLTQFSLPFPMILPKETKKHKGTNRVISSYLAVDPEWQFDNEYDPLWPNDYDKAVKELRERRDREAEEEDKRRRTEDDSSVDADNITSRDRDDDRDRRSSSYSSKGRTGAQIAPPPSLSQPSTTETESTPFTGAGGGGGIAAAAKIMAKYGYKEGQGLGRNQQGMSTALQVQKTSFRTGRIIHENDMQVTITNPLGLASSMAAYNDIEDEEYEDMEPPALQKEEEEATAAAEAEKQKEPTLADILKNPSNVLLLKNMVAPTEVDDDLEPEVKEECSKYGQVNNVTVFQMPDMDGEDAIRIFVEFASVDPAVKGFMDLNGRFFGGRQVKASFYDADKYNNLELTD